MEAKALWALVGVVLGSVLSFAGMLATNRINRCTERRDVARLLVSEVRFNDSRAIAFANVHERLSSGQELKDVQGNPIPLDRFLEAELLPGSFSFSTFDATLMRQAYFDRELMEPLQEFYRLLRQAEQFREAATSHDAPQLRAGFLKDVFESAAEAVKVAQEKNLAGRLEETSR